METTKTDIWSLPSFFCGDCPHCGMYISPQWMLIKGIGRTQEDVAKDYKEGIFSFCDSVNCPFCKEDVYTKKGEVK